MDLGSLNERPIILGQNTKENTSVSVNILSEGYWGWFSYKTLSEENKPTSEVWKYQAQSAIPQRI